MMRRWPMVLLLLLAAALAAEERVDPRHAGLPWGWLAFGFGAQALFMGRMLVQWLASERQGRSVVPPVFWWMSLLGSLSLVVYFWRRGDPVGIAGQAFGTVVYVRNLMLIHRRRVLEPTSATDDRVPA